MQQESFGCIQRPARAILGKGICLKELEFIVVTDSVLEFRTLQYLHN